MLRLLSLLLAAALCSCSAPEPTAALPPEWFEAVPPVHVVGPLWDVGTRDLRVFLVSTPAGLILIGGAMPGSDGLIEDSIRAAGFDPADIRILLCSHAHVDHVGTLARLQASTGARVEASAADAALLASGGATDYLFADVPPFHFQPVRVDGVLRDGDEVTLGGVTLTARLTPGHTPGNTTWLLQLPEGDRTWNVVLAGSQSVNPGTRLLIEPSYPGILDDYRRSLTLLESLPAEIWLAPHASQCGFQAKRERASTEGVRAFVDPEGYRAQLASWKAALERTLAQEQAAARADA